MKTIKDEKIITELLEAKVLMVNYMRYSHHSDDDMQGKTMCLFVNCHNLFSFKNNDFENIESPEELRELYHIWKNDTSYGVDIWCCKRREMQPNNAIKEIWKNNGIWNTELDDLKSNNA